MRTLSSSFLALALGMSLNGCGARDAAFDPTHFRPHGVLAPAEVVLPRGTRGGVVDGLYTQMADEGATCCFIAPHATLTVHKDGVASALEIRLYVPDIPLFERRAQRLTIGFPSNGGAKTVTSPLKTGFNSVTVNVPTVVAKTVGNVRVSLDAAVDYVPEPGTHARHYGVIVTSIYFE